MKIFQEGFDNIFLSHKEIIAGFIFMPKLSTVHPRNQRIKRKYNWAHFYFPYFAYGYLKNKLSQKALAKAVGLIDPNPNKLLNLTRRVLLF
jgi:5'(3')-deoxyribonucleotidase